MRLVRQISKIIPDYIYISIVYFSHFHKLPKLNNPATLNEKLQWLKLYDHDPKYPIVVDKCKAKDYVKELIGEKYIIPTINKWEKAEDIAFDQLPDQFVLKCNHDSGSVIICRDKANIDIEEIRSFFSKRLKSNGYWYGREWPYLNVKPMVLAEPLIINPDAPLENIIDYKFYCFDGYVDCVMACYERETGDPKFYFFDKDWNLLRINKRGKEAPLNFNTDKPKCIEEMFDIARKISVGFPFVRVDLYEVSGNVLFGEMTLYPSSGFDTNYLPETDLYFGSLINLPEKKI